MENDRWDIFIREHFDDDVDRLLLNKRKWPDIDIPLAASTISGHRKIREKVPSWYGNTGLVFPSSLSLEQCSSEFTASEKTRSICSLLDSDTAPDTLGIADLTGGLGVDSYVFSRTFGKVFYNEMNPALAGAAAHNFKVLGCRNITTGCCRIEDGASDSAGDSALSGQRAAELLKEFRPDIIYLDPARRDASGKKVFRIRECQPDVLKIKDELLSISRFVVIKLSPMADLDAVCTSLGIHCRKIDVISYRGECKEVVACLDREYRGGCTICARCSGNGEFCFDKAEENAADVLFADKIASGHIFTDGEAYLLEPDKALLKAGAFKILCSRFGLRMLERSTHYYVMSGFTEDNPDTEPESASVRKSRTDGFFKKYRIISILPLDRQGVKAAGRNFPKAEVTARNIPMTSDELRKKLGVKSSDRYHIFGLKVSQKDKAPGNFLFITEKVPSAGQDDGSTSKLL